ncbi:MAG: SUMF1/EgtB/PvdO family nonheme iron enzyme [Phycisphaerales bacterium]
MNPGYSAAALSTIVGFTASSAMATITIATVAVGNGGNSADPATGNAYGSVGYSYAIGSTEVTNAQYAAFLTAVAATDTNNLYNTNMAGEFGGITRSGSPGLYTYATVDGRENNPVNFVSYWDATRFANWLHNGQPTGPQDDSTTETGAYTLTAAGTASNTVHRNAGAHWAVTSEDEWYKAAYHQPASQGGDADDYWLYPTSSNTITNAQANYNFFIGNTTPVGSYAANYNGAFDMGGNVFEWNEAIISGSLRGIRGGSFQGNASLQATVRNDEDPTVEIVITGFRVSKLTPSVFGDLDGSGEVDGTDLGLLLGSWGPCGGCTADLSGDGAVDGTDLGLLLGGWS